MTLDSTDQAFLDSKDRRRPRRHLGTGFFLILLGLILALTQWHGSPLHNLGLHWPLILIAFGFARMMDRGLLYPFAHTAILVGLYFELDSLGHYDWIHRAWPSASSGSA